MLRPADAPGHVDEVGAIAQRLTRRDTPYSGGGRARGEQDVAYVRTLLEEVGPESQASEPSRTPEPPLAFPIGSGARAGALRVTTPLDRAQSGRDPT